MDRSRSVIAQPTPKRLDTKRELIQPYLVDSYH